MSSGLFSRERRHDVLRLFARLALVAGPMVLVVAALIASGAWSGPGGRGADAPFDLKATVRAGDDLLVLEADQDVVLWGSPDDVDLAAVECSTRDEQLTVDGAPAVPGTATATDRDGTSWIRLAVMADTQRTVTCSGGGLDQMGMAPVAQDVDRSQGGAFFAVWGVVIILAGFVALRVSRRPAS